MAAALGIITRQGLQNLPNSRPAARQSARKHILDTPHLQTLSHVSRGPKTGAISYSIAVSEATFIVDKS